MNTIVSSIAALVVTVLWFGPAQATDVRPYLEGHVGAVISSDGDFGSTTISYDPGLVAGGALGLDFERLRVEATIDYRRADMSRFNSHSVSGDLQLFSYMVNGHLVAPVAYPVKPYVLGGVGFATAFISNFAGSPGGEQSNTRFAYELGAGFGYDIQRNVTLDVTYRYFGTSDFDFNGTRLDYAANNVLFGVRYSY
jgi:opacity protein-like surface antigen